MKLETLFCDVVRVESSGKHLLVGVYASDSMFVPLIPGALSITAFTRVSEIPAGHHDIQMQFFSSAEPTTPIATYNTSINVTYPEFPTPIVAGPANLFLSNVGYVVVRFRITNWEGLTSEQVAGRIFVGRSPHK
jgi:hypothetical protein